MIENILLISPVDPFESTETPRITHYSELYLRNYCKNLTVFNYRKSTFSSKLHLAKFYVPAFKSWDIRRMNKRLLQLVNEDDYNLILIFKGEDLLPNTMKEIKEKHSAIIASWMGDDPFAYSNIKKSLLYYDYYFIWDSGYVKLLQDFGIKNVIHLPVYTVPEVFKKIKEPGEEKEKYGADIVFVGTWNSTREEVLKQLLGYHLKIYGNGWQKNSKIPKRYIRPEVTFHEINKIYKSCKIVLNIHHSQSKSGANFRTFEAMGAGAFLLDERKEDITSMFVDGEDLAVYSSVDELKYKIDYYLEREGQRKRIAKNGFQKVNQSHTLSHRYIRLFSAIEKSENSTSKAQHPRSYQFDILTY